MRASTALARKPAAMAPTRKPSDHAPPTKSRRLIIPRKLLVRVTEIDDLALDLNFRIDFPEPILSDLRFRTANVSFAEESLPLEVRFLHGSPYIPHSYGPEPTTSLSVRGVVPARQCRQWYNHSVR